ncbi:MAG: hypothetical protein V3S24_13290, partial [Candidatus Tectomicrobia bacterium]
RDTLEVQFKGIEQPITVYDVIGLQGQYALTLPDAAPEDLTPLASPLPITCYVVEGKTISEQAIPGTMTRLGATAAQVTLDGQVAMRANLKVVLDTPDAADLSEVYAKVLEFGASSESTAPLSVCLGFTALPEDTKAFLEQQLTAEV